MTHLSHLAKKCYEIMENPRLFNKEEKGAQGLSHGSNSLMVNTKNMNIVTFFNRACWMTLQYEDPPADMDAFILLISPPEKGLLPVYRRYLSWLFHESMYRDAFLTKDVNRILTHSSGVAVRTDLHHLYVMSALFTIRYMREYENIILTWDNFSRAGMDKTLAFIFAHQCYLLKKNRDYQFIQTCCMGNNHAIFGSQELTNLSFFLSGGELPKTEGPSLREKRTAVGIHDFNTYSKEGLPNTYYNSLLYKAVELLKERSKKVSVGEGLMRRIHYVFEEKDIKSVIADVEKFIRASETKKEETHAIKV